VFLCEKNRTQLWLSKICHGARFCVLREDFKSDESLEADIAGVGGGDFFRSGFSIGRSGLPSWFDPDSPFVEADGGAGLASGVDESVGDAEDIGVGGFEFDPAQSGDVDFDPRMDVAINGFDAVEVIVETAVGLGEEEARRGSHFQPDGLGELE